MFVDYNCLESFYNCFNVAIDSSNSLFNRSHYASFLSFYYLSCFNYDFRRNNYCNGERIVLLLLKFVIFLYLTIGCEELGDFCLTVLTHSFHGSIFPHNFINLHSNSMNLQLKVVNISSQIANIFFVDF